MEPCKGLFWWTGERLLFVQFPCGAGGNALGDAAPWRIGTTTAGPGPGCPRTSHRGKPLTTTPEAGGIAAGRAYLFLSPLLCREEVVLQVKDAFGLDQLPVLLKADGSHHYRCYLDE